MRSSRVVLIVWAVGLPLTLPYRAAGQWSGSVIGACCLDDGGCQVGDPELCLELQGAFVGDGSNCNVTNCAGSGAQSILRLVNGAALDERLRTFLGFQPEDTLFPRVRLRIRATRSDGSWTTHELITGTPGVVQAPFDPQVWADLVGNDRSTITLPCDVTRLETEPGSSIDVFVPVELKSYELVEVNENGNIFLTYVLRKTFPPDFRELLEDEVDNDGNVVLRRNIGVRDLPAPIVNPLCGVVITVSMEGVLAVPFLDGADSAPSYDRDDSATVAGIGGRFEFVVSIAGFEPFDIGACCVPGGSCFHTSQTDCILNLLGDYHGDGSRCEELNCADYGACWTGCMPEIVCFPGTPQECTGPNLDFGGLGSLCASSELAVGACCMGSTCNYCARSACLESGGYFWGAQSICYEPLTDCNEPRGACCIGPNVFSGDAFCIETTELGCAFAAEGAVAYEYLGNGTSCTDVECVAGCPGSGNCCRPHRSLGCNDAACCDAVCAVDPWCCYLRWWDEVCVAEARELCGVEPIGTDCNGNGIADQCDLFDDPLDDCDGNGLPDECDPDCDGDGIPNACEVAQCTPTDSGYPGCDDCNLNGVLDSCDISSGTSMDENPADRVPDECVIAAPTPMNLDHWSEPIWGLTGVNPYPDNQQGVADQHVSLIGAETNLLLDVSATIDSLRIFNGATLRVAQDGNQAGIPGDLTIEPTAPGGILIQGDAIGSIESRTSLLLAGDRRVDVSGGTLTIDTGGIYAALAPHDTTVSASLSAASIVVKAGCPDLQGGDLSLTGSMSATTTGDLVIDGTEGLGDDCTCDGRAVSGNVAGGETPPIVRVKGSGSVTVGGDVILTGNGTASVDDGASLIVEGDYRNEAVCPRIGVTDTHWEVSRLILRNATESHAEAASADLGRSSQGFIDNFALGTLEVVPGARIRIADRFDNRRRVGGRSEALYASRLSAGSGAQVTIENCTVYYASLDLDPTAVVNMVGTGQLSCLTSGDADCNGLLGLPDYATMRVCLTRPMGADLPPAVTFACRVFDFNNDGAADLSDFAHFQRGFEPTADSDGDGVSDDRDQCPGTPLGADVDPVGCPEQP